LTPLPTSSPTRSSYEEPAGAYHRPRDLLPVLLRAGSDRISTTAPAMDAHARIMRQAADEIEALAIEVKAATISLEISQRQLEELERSGCT
jgi:hypothetical protein